ncbi:MAG: hypothetical protein WD823_00020, partial [Sulfuricaulis sp.]|uniref:hypothetical protein n=1 Tax=Sulfuricaulis sp. TaxID=2003553 RepID=UPI0034A114D6
ALAVKLLDRTRWNDYGEDKILPRSGLLEPQVERTGRKRHAIITHRIGPPFTKTLAVYQPASTRCDR